MLYIRRLFTNDGSFVFTEQASGGGNAWVDSNLITAGGPVGLSVRQRASSGVFDVVMTRYSKESVTLSWGIWNRNTNSFAATWNEPSVCVFSIACAHAPLTAPSLMHPQRSTLHRHRLVTLTHASVICMSRPCSTTGTLMAMWT